MKKNKIRNMDEFAKLIRVSRPTISKYFNNPSSVRNQLRKKIELHLEKFDYVPNIYAINQNRELTKNIGIIVPYLADPFFAEIARILERLCIEKGYTPALFSSHGEVNLEIKNLEILRSLKPSGVLMAPIGKNSDKLRIEKFCKNIPTVLFDSKIEDLEINFIGSDNHSFIAQTVEYLNSTGRSPCFFEMKFPVNPNAEARRNSYLKVMKKLKLKSEIFKIEGRGWNFEEIGRQGALKLLRNNKLTTDTILCSNDRLAIGLLSACHEMGLKVGKDKNCDLRVASNDDHPYAKYTCPSLTTCAHDYLSVANTAIETLLSQIKRINKKQSISKRFKSKLILRESA